MRDHWFKVFEYGSNRGPVLDLSVVPTRYFLGKPTIGEEMHISIEKGKTLIIKVLAVGSVDENLGTRDVWFEVNGEVSPHLFVIDRRVTAVRLTRLFYR